ncbi:MAG: CRISPR-associated protein (Cas_Cas02710) [Deltaproteobacteria bacterium ADurb.BinA179]|jgi:CRISPR-associated protein (TIGR02710 family)|nr:MAG: CRISPR-associated protein (Cas_Cas02710) [Deltaproteobacteria bacterium ADurb.BinA179]HOD70750.1 TIGR02710 family CRISPR-associated CARF protein [Deltaproteobacteria bacterium]HQM20942.1 TIGR02710 family CRISPR-associated CARF protein [Deltaproteobacteria bacterium]HRC99184.1 TIGR02710 family CRISPR-associated CARF protein [Deltaproteobacteria bacterium]
MPRVMIMSIGGSPEPLKASIAKYKPEQVIFFTSQDSTQIAGEVLSALDSRPKVFYEITENPNLLFECYKTARACVDRISSLGAQSHEVMVDYTGGTKVMSAALILATTGHPFLFNYVGGDFRDRDKNGLGTVVDGKEKMFSEMSPWSIYAEEERRQVIALFNHRRYAAVISIIDACSANQQCPARISDYFGFVRSFSEAFLLWEQFIHRAALRKIETSIRKFESYARRYTDPPLGVFAQNTQNLRSFLADLVEKTSGTQKKYDMSLVQDLVSNARRRMLDKRFDDAAARIYRALEMYGQVCFTEMAHCSNSEVKPDIVPESIRHEFIRRYENPSNHRLKLPLHATFVFLKEKGHDAGLRFFEQATLKKMKDIQSNRNQSILAHGTKPVSEYEIDSMFETICEFLQIKTFIEFPELPW